MCSAEITSFAHVSRVAICRALTVGMPKEGHSQAESTSVFRLVRLYRVKLPRDAVRIFEGDVMLSQHFVQFDTRVGNARIR